MNKLIGLFALLGLAGYAILMFLLVALFGIRVLVQWEVLSIALAFAVPALIAFSGDRLTKGAALVATLCFGYLTYRGCAGAITELALGNLLLGIGTIGGLGTSVLALLSAPSDSK
jgi:hypothetical protein